MPQFEVQFDILAFQKLDRLALLARQDYNLGGNGDWFGEFRGGLYGMYDRLYGVQLHYFEVHAWLPRHRFVEGDYHLASILFQMDSALECLAFALNALGWIVMPDGFRDVTDAKAMKQISPRDILGEPTGTSSIAPKSGYAKVFPNLQRAWQGQTQLIGQIRDLHDVSKHRKTLPVNGQLRSDPPDGFREALGIPEDAPPHTLWQFSPMAEIILRHDPKEPEVQRRSKPAKQGELLEDIVPIFAGLIRSSGVAALADAHANVPLKEKNLR